MPPTFRLRDTGGGRRIVWNPPKLDFVRIKSDRTFCTSFYDGSVWDVFVAPTPSTGKKTKKKTICFRKNIRHGRTVSYNIMYGGFIFFFSPPRDQPYWRHVVGVVFARSAADAHAYLRRFFPVSYRLYLFIFLYSFFFFLLASVHRISIIRAEVKLTPPPPPSCHPPSQSAGRNRIFYAFFFSLLNFITRIGFLLSFCATRVFRRRSHAYT